MDFKDLYSQLKGVSRVKKGELWIADFTNEDYENLFYTLLEILAPFIGDNYEYWYTQKARSYHKYKQGKAHTFDFYNPQYEKPVEAQTIREQLVVIKFFIQRRAYSKYPMKGE